MLGDSSVQLPTSGESAADIAIGGGGGGGGGGGDQEEKSSSSPVGVGEDEGDVNNNNNNNNNNNSNNINVNNDDNKLMNFGANRWPRQETLALLKIRSDMDQIFRDSSHKGPLWEEVSRKMGELGYNRRAKKCKEKFENVYKYNKRTKEGRTNKPEGKTYKFFDQLRAFESNPSQNTIQPPIKTQNPILTNSTTLSFSTTNNINNPPNVTHVITSTNNNVPSTKNNINFMSLNNAITTNPITFPTTTATQVSSQPTKPALQTYQTMSSNLFSSSTSSSTASDEGLEGSQRKRKRKWKAFFAKLTKDVIKKQEELQAKFLEKVERHERDRMAREESWRVKEMARISREHGILLQERSVSAAKDNALIAFLQKVPVQGQYNINQPPSIVQPTPTPPPQPLPPLQQQTQPRQPTLPPSPVITSPATLTIMETVQRNEHNGDKDVTNVAISSSNRWPKAEVQALISLRTNLDLKYQESNGAKGTLWEEVSIGMQKLGYNRNAKKCKEKWENINKYFKKVRDSNKKRGEDSKTCPYFHQLDVLYKEKSKNGSSPNYSSHIKRIGSTNMEPLMVQPEQQWPPPPQQESNLNQSIEAEDEEDDMDDDDENGETDQEEEGVGFEVVANKPS